MESKTSFVNLEAKMFQFINLNLRQFILLCVAILVPFISINVEQNHEDKQWIAKPLDTLTEAVDTVFYTFSEGVRGTTSEYLNLLNIKKTNAAMKLKNAELAVRQSRFEEIFAENDRLHALLNFKQTNKMQLIAAEIIGGDLLKDHRTITINKGSKHGIRAGQGVITLNGVLGYIFRSHLWTSTVMLIEDRYAVVDAVIQRTRAQGIVEGKGQGGCALKYIERSEDVKVGDTVVTGGLDNIFPKGFPIAVVENVERKTYSVSLKVDLRPVVDTNKIEEIFVIADAALEDLTQLYIKDQALKAPEKSTLVAGPPSPSSMAPPPSASGGSALSRSSGSALSRSSGSALSRSSGSALSRSSGSALSRSSGSVLSRSSGSALSTSSGSVGPAPQIQPETILSTKATR